MAQAYSVVHFLQKPFPEIQPYIVVPSSWILQHAAVTVLVAYPTEAQAKTKLRIAKRENYLELWNVYRAEKKYETDFLKVAESWIKKAERSDMKQKALEQNEDRTCITESSDEENEGELQRKKATKESELRSSKKDAQLDLNVPRVLKAPDLNYNPAIKQSRKRPLQSTSKSEIYKEPSESYKELNSRAKATSPNNFINIPSSSSQTSHGLHEKKQIRRTGRQSLFNAPPKKQNEPSEVNENLHENDCLLDDKQVRNAHGIIKTLPHQSRATKQLSYNVEPHIHFKSKSQEYASDEMDLDGDNIVIGNPEPRKQLQSRDVLVKNDKNTPYDVLLTEYSNQRSKGIINRTTGDDINKTPRRKSRMMYGQNTNSDLKVARCSLYVSRFDNTVTEKILLDHFFKHDIDVLEVMLLPHRYDNNFLSFKITINEADRNRVLNENFWPKGIIFRRFEEKSLE